MSNKDCLFFCFYDILIYKNNKVGFYMTQDIDIKRVLDNFKQRIVLIAFIAFLTCTLVSGYALFLEKPYYKATATLVLTGITSSNSKDTAITTNDLTINSKLVDTYQEIIKSKKVLNQVLTYLNLEYEIDELAKMIEVSSVNETEIISITVTNQNPEIASRIANKVSNVFSSEVTKIYNIENVSILDAAEIPNTKANMSFIKQFVISFIVGVFIGCFIAFVLAYFDTTVKTVDQIEEITNLPILGRVPNYNDKRKGRK